MRSAILIPIFLAAASLPTVSKACNPDTGTREQSVVLSWNGERVKRWVVNSDAMENLALPNGFSLGIRIEPAKAEKYAQLDKNWKYVPELVKISLFDMSETPPRLLTSTWGGTNSLQRYGAKGGADRVKALGNPGVLLTLLKPVCAKQHVSALKH